MRTALRPSFSMARYFAPSITPAESESLARVAQSAARLSHLELPEDGRVEGALRDMLSFAALLRKVKTEGVEPLEVFADYRGLEARRQPTEPWRRSGLQVQEGEYIVVPIPMKNANN